MASLIGWLDQSEEQQRSMGEVIALFAESGTIDDLGLGIVRDAFADLLFPGLSTVQTRVRYFLFIPWTFQRLEAEGIRSADAASVSRQWEVDLITSLIQGTGTTGISEDGIIGQEAREKLKQLPSYIYWSGALKFGIREFGGSRADYFRLLDRTGQSSNDEGDVPAQSRWHVNLPPMPHDLWSGATLALRHEEAAYLQERMIDSQPDSLLAHFLRYPTPVDPKLPFVWDAIDPDSLAPELANILSTARYYSEAMHGAPLLYNLMLAEQAEKRELPVGEGVEHYARRLDEWRAMIIARHDAHQIGLHEFWTVAESSQATIPYPTRTFINEWLTALRSSTDVANSLELREMITIREKRLKKGLARLSNPRTLETWGGAAGLVRFAYRWNEGRSAINDIAAGLGVTSA